MPKSLSEFTAAVRKDRTPEIRAYLRKLGARYVNEVEMCRSIRLSTADLPRYRAKFPKHLVPHRGRDSKPGYLWAGTPKLASQMRELSNG